MNRIKSFLFLFLMMAVCLSFAGCKGNGTTSFQESVDFSSGESGTETRWLVDGAGRRVEIPVTVERAVCVGVGALRYSCYVGAAGYMVGVEDYETKPGMSRLYQYVYFDTLKDLPVIGTNGVPSSEAIIQADPQVIVMSSYASADPDQLSLQTEFPWWWCREAIQLWMKRPTIPSVF